MKNLPKPVDEDDMSEYWRSIREAGQNKRAGNRAAALSTMIKSGLAFTPNNGGAHFIVSGLHETKAVVVDYWPGTGLWIVRGMVTRRYGIRNLLQYLEVK